MKKLCIALLTVAALVFGATAAFAWDEEPATVGRACDGDVTGQGWDGRIGILNGPRAGQYYAVVFGDVNQCTPIETAQFKAIARRFIRTGSVYDLADPAVWTVTIL